MESSNHLSEGVRNTFETHHNEIRRRSDLIQSGTVNSSTFSRVDTHGLDDPFVHPEQRFIVFSLSTKEFAPIPENLKNPAVCIYGAFETMNDAHAHARVVEREHPGFSILVDSTHKWIVAASTVEHLTDPEFVKAHTEKLLHRFEEQLKKNKQEFEENVVNRVAGKVEMKEDDPPRGDHSNPSSAQLRVNLGCRLSEQKLLAVSFVQDVDDVPEFLFRVYACYETEEAMNRYVCNTCGDRVTSFDIDVIKTCTWAYPQRMLDGKNVAKEVYRSSELNNVMNTHKKNPQEVERFYNDHPDANSQPDGANTAPIMEVSDQLRNWDMLTDMAE
jgi:hypothetical protein